MQAGFEPAILLPQSPRVLGLQVCDTTTNSCLHSWMNTGRLRVCAYFAFLRPKVISFYQKLPFLEACLLDNMLSNVYDLIHPPYEIIYTLNIPNYK